jgi:protein SCO1/2
MVVLGSVMLLVIGVVAVAKWKTWGHAAPQKIAQLPSGRSTDVIFAAPRFSLIDENGNPFSADTLRGRAYICDFIFTTCGSACPLMTQKLAALQGQTPAGLQLISFTVNPEHDTPAVLKQYAAARGADPRRWHFLTGTTGQMIRTVREMKLGFQAANDRDPILHSEKFLLIDGDGNVRGIYDSLDGQSMKELVADAAWLAGTPGARGK